MLKELLETIRRETQPIAGHTDPGAIEDCWRSVFEELEAVEHGVHPTDGGLCAVCGKLRNCHEDHDYVAPIAISG